MVDVSLVTRGLPAGGMRNSIFLQQIHHERARYAEERSRGAFTGLVIPWRRVRLAQVSDGRHVFLSSKGWLSVPLPAVAGACRAPDPTGLSPIVGRFLRQGETSTPAPILSELQGYHPHRDGARAGAPFHSHPQTPR